VVSGLKLRTNDERPLKGDEWGARVEQKVNDHYCENGRVTFSGQRDVPARSGSESRRSVLNSPTLTSARVAAATEDRSRSGFSSRGVEGALARSKAPSPLRSAGAVQKRSPHFFSKTSFVPEQTPPSSPRSFRQRRENHAHPHVKMSKLQPQAGKRYVPKRSWASFRPLPPSSAVFQHEFIPYAVHRDQVAGLVAGVAELAAQLHDHLIQGPGRAVILIPPNVVQEPISG